MMNIIGNTYGRLKVIEELERKSKYVRRYKCQCKCENYTIVNQGNLLHGRIQSCGCLQKESASQRLNLGENTIIRYADHAEIVMFDQDGNEKARAIIDLEDVELVRGYRWWLTPSGYTAAKIKPTTKVIKLHQLICPAPEDVDHWDRDKLNCRRLNLRPANSQQNAMNQGLKRNNKSGVKGVYRNKARENWVAEIMKEGKKYYLGQFVHKEDAIRARQKAEKELFGEFSAIV